MDRLRPTGKLRELDELIRAGSVDEAREKLQALQIKDIANAQRAALGRLFIRVNLPHKALIALNRNIRLGNGLNPDADTADLLTYALALIRIGSAQEAGEILKTLPQENAEARLFQAFMHQTMWDYTEALPHLEAYLGLKSPTPYERAVAEVNVAACLVQMREFPQAEETLKKLLADADANQWLLLMRNAIELTAQAAVEQGRMQDARNLLKTIDSGHSEVLDPADLFVAKWAAFADAFENVSPTSIAGVRRVREMAKRMNHWETLRDCDRALAGLTRDEGLFNHVYFGTPFVSFRKKVLAGAPWMNNPSTYTLGSSTGPVFDLVKAEMRDGSARLKPGQIMHRTLCALLEDFYRPVSLGHLHGRLFPGQYFNPESSPGRVSSLIHRLRNWLEDVGLPITITASQRNFQISLTDPHFGIHFSRLLELQTTSEISDVAGYLDRIRERLNHPFTCTEAAESLSVSRSAAVRILKEAVAAGLVRRVGKGRGTLYRW